MRKIKMLVAGIVLAAATLVGGMMVAQPVSAAECPAGSLNSTYKNSLAECNIESTAKGEGLLEKNGVVNRGINLAIGIAGILAVVMIIAGGISMTTSAGDAAKVKKAKDTILYGVVGLVIALLAFAIVNFVLGSLFGASTDKGTNSEEESYVNALVIANEELNQEV